METRTLYHEVIEVASDYLGPAAPRFIGRLIKAHLHKKPSEMSPDDLPLLVDWTLRTTAMLTDNGDELRNFEERLMDLSNAIRNSHSVNAAQK